MDETLISSNSEACLHFIYFKFDTYKNILDHDQQICDQLISSIREQIYSYNNSNDEKFQLILGYDRNDLFNQLNYFEQEAFKTYEENKTCLFKMFQKLFLLHREFAFHDVLLHEKQIAQLFQYRPSLLPNIEKLHCFIRNSNEKNSLIFSPTSKTFLTSSISFSNRADIEAFQQQQSILINESNEIDLTKFIRETYTNHKSEQFQFSKLSQNLQQQQKTISRTKKKIRSSTISCDDALLTSANKRFVLLYNMNTIHILYLYDIQEDETKEFPWNENIILSLGHVDSNIFYLISSTKIFLFDIIKEYIIKEYFLYDTLYKDLLLITDNLSYKTQLKRNNQIQSIAYDDYCYYLYTNKEYNQILIKCSLENFQPELNLNLTKKYPYIEYFLGLTLTTKSLITFLIFYSNTYELLFCNELDNYNIIKKFPINSSLNLTKILSTYLTNISIKNNQNKIIQSNKQLWLILDKKFNSIHCLTQDNYLKTISFNQQNSIQSIAIYDKKLFLAYNELSVEIFDLDYYFSSLEL